MTISHQLQQIEEEALAKIKAASSLSRLEELRIIYLGRKGTLTLVLKEIGKLPAEEKPRWGKEINSLKQKLLTSLREQSAELTRKEETLKLEKERLDTTLPGVPINLGRLHPITQILNEIVETFLELGFQIAEGPDIENEYYNFEALNFPKDHPSRDMQDTLFAENDLILRTHTSPVQIRVMEKYKPPLRIIAPGKVYRCDADISHSPMFHQVEGFMVDYHINFSHLKGILRAFLNRIFGKDTKVRFRPSFFPFTEPSAEVDISCFICAGKGCRVCSESGWVEILGAGMIHPNVFKTVSYPPLKFRGFAFGMGIERIAMLRYGISDIRLFFENDIRFLRQF